jgi:hypothetical protein
MFKIKGLMFVPYTTETPHMTLFFYVLLQDVLLSRV